MCLESPSTGNYLGYAKSRRVFAYAITTHSQLLMDNTYHHL